MATNAKTTVEDDDKQVTEDDLRNLKYGEDEVETSQEEDESTDTTETEEESEEAEEEAGQTDDQTEEETSEETESDDVSEFVKEFPNIKGETLEEYARNLEKAYNNSTAEFQRLRQEQLTPKETKIGDDEEVTQVDLTNPVSLYMKQKMDEEITSAYLDFSKQYPQVSDQTEYNKFTQEVATLSQTILQSQKRLAPPRELYSKAAIILGWEPDQSTIAPTSKEKLNMALKSTVAVSKTPQASSKKVAKSKVTDAMVKANRLMYPNKSDAEIREELEPYVQ